MMSKQASKKVEELANSWFEKRKWSPFQFQKEVWRAMAAGKNGLLNAPTGSGKTYALWIPAVLEHDHSTYKKGLKVLWITPLRVRGIPFVPVSVRLGSGCSDR